MKRLRGYIGINHRQGTTSCLARGRHRIASAVSLRLYGLDRRLDADRQKQLLALIENATGKAAYIGTVQEEGEYIEADADTIEAEMTVAVD